MDVASQSDGKIVALGEVSVQSNVDYVMMRLDEAGHLDPTFVVGGIAKAELPGEQGRSTALHVMPDDRIVVVGDTDGDVFAAKFKRDGDAARAFGKSGVVVTDLGGEHDSAAAVLLDEDGRVLVLARAGRSGDEVQNLLLRFDRRGALDETFGDDGRLLLGATGSGRVRSMSMAGDGSVFILGSDRGGAGDVEVLRLAPEGRIDESFGVDGRARFGWRGPLPAQTWQLLQAPDGKVYALASIEGPYTNHPAIVRFDENGRLDRSFGGGDGKLVLRRTRNHGARIALDREGRLLLVTGEEDTEDTTVRRFGADGVADRTFGTRGPLVIPDRWVYAGDIEVQDDGRIIIGGAQQLMMRTANVLVRLMPDGSLDTSFGTGGIVTTEMRYISSSVSDVIVPSDGRILTVGTSKDIVWPTDMDNVGGMVAARYEPDGTLDESFHGDGRIFFAVGRRQEADGVAGHLLDDGGVLIVGKYAFRDELILARLKPDGSPDTAFGKNGRRTFRPGGDPVGASFFDDGSLLLQRAIDDDVERHARIFWRIDSDGRRDEAFGEAVIRGLPHTGEFLADAAGRVLFGGALGEKLAVGRYRWQ